MKNHNIAPTPAKITINEIINDSKKEDSKSPIKFAILASDFAAINANIANLAKYVTVENPYYNTIIISMLRYVNYCYSSDVNKEKNDTEGKWSKAS